MRRVNSPDAHAGSGPISPGELFFGAFTARDTGCATIRLKGYGFSSSRAPPSSP